MKSFLKDNYLYLLLFACWMAVGGVLLASYDKADLHLLLNTRHSSVADFIFSHYTLLAEFGPYIVAAGLLFYKASTACYVLLAELLAGGVTQIVKNIVCAPRPKVFFDIANNPDILPLVDGVRLHSSFSFPSGHTTTFFALATTLVVIVGQTQWGKENWKRMLFQLCIFFFALLGGYSRIYLSQHFMADVYVGSIIGLVVAFLLMPLLTFIQQRFPRFSNWHLPVHKRSK